MHVYTSCMCSASEGQKVALDPLELELQTECECTFDARNSSPQEEQQVIFRSEPSLQQLFVKDSFHSFFKVNNFKFSW